MLIISLLTPITTHVKAWHLDACALLKTGVVLSSSIKQPRVVMQPHPQHERQIPHPNHIRGYKDPNKRKATFKVIKRGNKQKWKIFIAD